MCQFRVKKVDGRAFFSDRAVDELFNVEVSDGDGSWSTVSTHLSLAGAEKKLRRILDSLFEGSPSEEQPDFESWKHLTEEQKEDARERRLQALFHGRELEE